MVGDVEARMLKVGCGLMWLELWRLLIIKLVKMLMMIMNRKCLLVILEMVLLDGLLP